MTIKKIVRLIMVCLLMSNLSACRSQHEKTEDTTEASRLLAEGMKQREEQEKQVFEEKKKRINTEKQFIKITGEIMDIFTKVDSGLDMCQLTVKVQSVENDSHHLYTGELEKEYIYFISPKEFPKVDFSKIKNGDFITIETFKDAYLTETEPKQIGENDIVNVIIK